MKQPTSKKIHNRRHFIRQTALVSIGFMALTRCVSDRKYESSSGIALVEDPNHFMDLPEGFQYRIISRAGESMTDGLLLPGRPDGMGAFEGRNNKVIVIRNHENSPDYYEFGAFGKNNEQFASLEASRFYDPGFGEMPGLGGTTTFIYDEQTGQIEQQYLSLAGTYRNCAGGVTPWNTWLSCEEDVTLKGDKVEKDHGFVFEIPATDQIQLADPIPLIEMGRFNHEAVAVDPKTGIVYQTEDAHDGLIYRFIPNTLGKLNDGGKLQVLAIQDQPSFDTRNWEERTINLNEPLAVEWLDIDNVLSPENDLRLRGFNNGAARFARGEGIWFGENELYFACTNGGPSKLGQVFRYQTSAQEGTSGENSQPGILELFAESPEKNILHNCDNLTIAPWGDVILCEDNGEINHIRGINQKGEIYNIACNKSSKSEFAGLVFSPSGKTLFVNVQESGETVAITGPWERMATG